jgi:hypothetical protein
MAKAKAKKKATTGRARTTARSVKKAAAGAKKASRSVAKTARRASKSPIGKAAAKVLAGATAGAVRAIIPQLEEAASSQEQVAERGKAGKKRQTPSRQA